MKTKKYNNTENKKELYCPHCKRILRTKFYTLMIKMPEFCLYCGYKIN